MATTLQVSNESVQGPAGSETIAFLLDYAPQTWCSREDYHVALCQALTRSGVRSVLVFAKPLPPRLATLLSQKGIEFFTIDYSKGLVHYHRELGSLVKQFSVTAVHICYFDYFSAIAWMARLHGVKTIVYEAVNSGSFTAGSWKKFLLRARTAIMTKPITRVIAISEFVKSQLVASGLIGDKINVRYLGVDQARFVPNHEASTRLRNEFAIGPDEVIVITVSFLNPFKNPQIIIEACSLLSNQGFKFQLFVAGDGVLRTQLENLSRTLGIADRVHWLGHVADPLILLQGSDIFTLASTGEAFGLVLPEAMGCGLPVVATRSGGIVEIVEDSKTGFLVSPFNAEALAKGLKQLMESPTLREEMGARGRERVEQMFTIDEVVANTMRLYESMNLTGKTAKEGKPQGEILR